MTLVRREQFLEQFDYALEQQLRGDVATSFVYRVKEFCWYDNNTMREQMRQWRKLAKNGKLIMRKCNNKNFEYEGKEYYLLEAQGSGEDPTCLIGLFVAGMIVNGFGYVFLNESSRDKVYEYVMKDIVV
jgi:hypothetical protein